MVITQHRDGLLIKSFPYYFQCGRVENLKNKATVNFRVSKFQDIYDKIIPFFKKYPILGVKALDFDPGGGSHPLLFFNPFFLFFLSNWLLKKKIKKDKKNNRGGTPQGLVDVRSRIL